MLEFFFVTYLPFLPKSVVSIYVLGRLSKYVFRASHWPTLGLPMYSLRNEDGFLSMRRNVLHTQNC